MAVCPNCRAEYLPDAERCGECGIQLQQDPPAGEPLRVDDTWVPVLSAHEIALDLMRDVLAALEIPSARIGRTDLGPIFAVNVPGGIESKFDTVVVPPGVYEARRDDIDAAVESIRQGEQGDAQAMAEAEEDWDVTGCPNCHCFFHMPPDEAGAACPGCGASLVPAVEVMAEGQLTPGRVIVHFGAEQEARALAARLEGAGFHPSVEGPRGWTAYAVELPWAELTDRTREAEAILWGAVVQ